MENEIKVRNENTDIQVANDGSPMARMAELMSKGLDIDVDKMAKLLEVQKDYEANEARKAYHAAMTAFKENPPKIIKDKHVSFNQTSYNHASLANVLRIISAEMSNHGLSVAWETGQTESGQIKVTCRVTHTLGHSESTSLVAAPDNSGKKNPIQAIGSTVSYLERYTLLAITGLTTEDMDDDGNGGDDLPLNEIVPPTNEQMEVVRAIVEKLPPANKGMVISPEKVARFFYFEKGAYPQHIENAHKAAEFVVQKNPQNIYTKDTRGEFEQKYDIPE